MSELDKALESRLLAVLKNPANIDQGSITASISDTTEILGGRVPPQYLSLDIAMYRYKIRAKVPPSESETMLYTQALKKLDKYPVVDTEAVITKTSFVKVGQRASEGWDI